MILVKMKYLSYIRRGTGGVRDKGNGYGFY
jgi:hypothetical protein